MGHQVWAGSGEVNDTDLIALADRVATYNGACPKDLMLAVAKALRGAAAEIAALQARIDELK